MKIYIKSKKDNTYLFPFYHQKNWVNSISDAFAFEIESEDNFNITDIVPDTIYRQKDKLVAVKVVNGVEKEIPEKKLKNYILSYEEFFEIKKNFHSFKDKEFVHYIIYSFIKGQDPYISVRFSTSKKMQFTLFKIKKAKFLIKNHKYTIDYIGKPFNSLPRRKLERILKEILEII